MYFFIVFDVLLHLVWSPKVDSKHDLVLASSRMISILVLFLGRNAGILAEDLQCHRCAYLSATDHCVQDLGTAPISCEQNAKYCSIGVRANFTKPDGTKASALERNCANAAEVKQNDRLWSKLPAGYKYVCESTASSSGTDLSEAPNRICVCDTPLCNGAAWDEIMVQPVLKRKFSDADVPQVQPLGSRSYRNFFNFTTRSPARSLNLSESRSVNITSEEVTTPPNGTGLGIGAIIGIVAGALIFLFLLVTIVIVCYRRYHKKKKKKKTAEEEEDDTGASRSSRTSGLIAGDGNVKSAGTLEKSHKSPGAEYIDRHAPKPLPEGPVGGGSTGTSQGGPKVFWGETYQ